MSKLYKRKNQQIKAIQYNGKNLKEVKQLIPDLKEWQEFWSGRNMQYRPNKTDYFLIDQEAGHVELINQDDFDNKYDEIKDIDFQRLFDQDTDYGNSSGITYNNHGSITTKGIAGSKIGNLFLFFISIVVVVFCLIMGLSSNE